ncbi:hypothetical protein BRE01_36640 [Brevibacillus reuszeri]|uniref:Uncharacterized protein n=1 Tax=Brevibacillus reuszeri TaxID=54915 RepID=A0ABQ0TQ30_9BACL|nr:hypothetical protein BRE01_36640 [Brevibacillus reuszeri]
MRVDSTKTPSKVGGKPSRVGIKLKSEALVSPQLPLFCKFAHNDEFGCCYVTQLPDVKTYAIR